MKRAHHTINKPMGCTHWFCAIIYLISTCYHHIFNCWLNGNLVCIRFAALDHVLHIICHAFSWRLSVTRFMQFLNPNWPKVQHFLSSNILCCIKRLNACHGKRHVCCRLDSSYINVCDNNISNAVVNALSNKQFMNWPFIAAARGLYFVSQPCIMGAVIGSLMSLFENIVSVLLQWVISMLNPFPSISCC